MSAERTTRLVTMLVCVLGVVTAVRADTYYVNGTCGNDAWSGQTPECVAPDGPKATIQAGIDAAQTGDTVLVADSVYGGAGNYNLSFGGKAITLRSAGGPSQCVIDCYHFGRAFLFTKGETEQAVLQGFTIRNGTSGGALGAGIEVLDSSPTIRDCIFEDNSAGIYNGGAIHFGQNSQSLLINCTMRRGVAGGGGALFCEYSAPSVVNCVFRENSAGVGGAVLCTGAQPLFFNCLFIENQATDAFWGGGAIFCNASSIANVVNCTITRNTTPGTGGALYSNKYSAPVVVNSILWDNTSPEIFVSPNSGTPTVTYSNVQGGYTGQGNINADPRFLDPGQDYRLSRGSPCIDAADNTAVPPGITTDLAGNPRFVDDPATPDTGVSGGAGGDAIVDMGAYEFMPVGDLNCDGVLNAFDIDPFVLALTDPAGYAAAYPNCDRMLADIDGDGQVNAFDIDPFVALLTNP